MAAHGLHQGGQLLAEEAVEGVLEGPPVRDSLAVRSWGHAPHRADKVAELEADALDVDDQLLIGRVDLWVPPAERPEGRLDAECLDVGATVADHLRSELVLEGHRERRVPRLCVDVEDGAARLAVGQTKHELPVETPRAAERRVDGVDAVGRADHNDLAAAVEAVHEGEERGHDG